MQRRDPRTFLEGVFAQVPDLDESMRLALLDIVSEKPGTKRAARIAQILSAESAKSEVDDDE